MYDFFSRFDAWAVTLTVGLVMTAAWGLGWLYGKGSPNLKVQQQTKFEDSVLAILGLLLAFTFSLSLAKHDQRRLMVVAESNAVGDFYTCASLLPQPARGNLQRLIREYVTARLDFVEKIQGKSPAEIAKAQKLDMLLLSKMTELTAQAVAEGTPIAVSLANTLNEVGSAQASRRAAMRDKLPPSIVFLLLCAAFFSTLLVGRQQGGLREPQLMDTLSFIVLVAFSVYVTLDLNQPFRGYILVSHEPLTLLLESMGN